GARTRVQEVGDYGIIGEIGGGGMGVVYEAEQVSLGRHVALKLLPQKLLLDERSKRRFEREARAAAKLHHTNIVPVFGVGEHDGLPYYVMQFIQGLGLDEVLKELKQLQGGQAAGAAGGGTLPPAPRDVSAAAVARSLLTGAFQPAATKEEADVPEAVELTQDHVSVPRATQPAGPLSETVSLSSSSVVLP